MRIARASLLIGLVGCGGGGGDAHDDLVEPGRVVLHRLNRAEYDNTVRDLLGTELTPAKDFPFDDHGYGFDNIAATLSVSPLHVELYEQAARRLADDALIEHYTKPVSVHIEGESEVVEGSTGRGGTTGYNLWSNGWVRAEFDAPAAGTYVFKARLWGTQAGDEPVHAFIGFDMTEASEQLDITATTVENAQTVEVEVELTEGKHLMVVWFTNDYYNPDLGEDRNLLIDWMEVEGPFGASEEPNPLRARHVTCDPGPDPIGCAERVLRPLMSRAYRRPVDDADVAKLMVLVQSVLDDGGEFDDAIQAGLQAVLLSPRFIYRVEETGGAQTISLDDYEIASRLSYFLWSSMPDDQLLKLAAEGRLSDHEVIAQQVRRMLDDPKADALVENFAGQWLLLRAIGDHSPDEWFFPDFDADLRSSMREESDRFFRSFLRDKRDMRELLTATEGEVDARLARHYELSVDPGPGWVMTDLSARQRGGLLGQAGVLMTQSYPTRTSPVLRGKYVLAHLLCAEPPPPPAGVEGLTEEDDPDATLRERLERHREDPVCASCHDQMDPVGFSMEHFDGVGAWRDDDAGHPVDASGVLPDGTEIYGMRELSAVVAVDPRLPRCISKNLMTYALGRGVGSSERSLDLVEQGFMEGGYTFEALAVAIATDDSFVARGGE
ncbi:MAG: hypothetical protein ACI9MC_000299 [Kiritimatiellia bacterium]|jgi:hypothetical protein